MDSGGDVGDAVVAGVLALPVAAEAGEGEADGGGKGGPRDEAGEVAAADDGDVRRADGAGEVDCVGFPAPVARRGAFEEGGGLEGSGSAAAEADAFAGVVGEDFFVEGEFVGGAEAEDVHISGGEGVCEGAAEVAVDAVVGEGSGVEGEGAGGFEAVFGEEFAGEGFVGVGEPELGCGGGGGGFDADAAEEVGDAGEFGLPAGGGGEEVGVCVVDWARGFEGDAERRAGIRGEGIGEGFAAENGIEQNVGTDGGEFAGDFGAVGFVCTGAAAAEGEDFIDMWAMSEEFGGTVLAGVDDAGVGKCCAAVRGWLRCRGTLSPMASVRSTRRVFADCNSLSRSHFRAPEFSCEALCWRRACLRQSGAGGFAGRGVRAGRRSRRCRSGPR